MIDLVALRDIGHGCGTIHAGARFRADQLEARDRVAAADAAYVGTVPRWNGLDWSGAAVVILASGPSLTAADVGLVNAWRVGAPHRRVIAINTTFRLAPWADMVYGCDAPWWTLYGDEVRRACAGQLWTQDRRAIGRERMQWIDSLPLPGLSRRQGLVHQGANSGYQAINVAFLAGARRIILLGFDLQGLHWHGAHPAPLTNPREDLFRLWAASFDRLAVDLRAEDVDAVNCSRATALDAFRRAPLAAELT